MTWAVFLALVIAIPALLFSFFLIWYLNVRQNLDILKEKHKRHEI